MSTESEDFEKFRQVLSYLNNPITKAEKALSKGATIMIHQRQDNKEFHVAILKTKKMTDHE